MYLAPVIIQHDLSDSKEVVALIKTIFKNWDVLYIDCITLIITI